jgi:hypothetical protein
LPKLKRVTLKAVSNIYKTRINLDTLALILWFLMFATPLFTIPVVWKLSNQPKVFRIVIGLLIAFVLSFILYHLSLAIIFRDGMGPG